MVPTVLIKIVLWKNVWNVCVFERKIINIKIEIINFDKLTQFLSYIFLILIISIINRFAFQICCKSKLVLLFACKRK